MSIAVCGVLSSAPAARAQISSVRISGLSPNFSGLIRDRLDDYVRNPAIALRDDGGLIYSDFSPIPFNNTYQVTLGGAANPGRSEIGAFVSFHDGRSRRTTSQDSTRPGDRSKLLDSFRDIGQSLTGYDILGSYSYRWENGITAGIGFTYDAGSNNSRDSMAESNPSSDPVSWNRRYSMLTGGHYDIITAGVRFPSGANSLQLYGSFETSSSTETTFDGYVTDSGGLTRDEVRNFKRESLSLGGIYEVSPGERTRIRYLMEFGLSGNRSPNSGLNQRYGITVGDSSSQDESIQSGIDDDSWYTLKLGVGLEGRLADGFVVFAGPSVYGQIGKHKIAVREDLIDENGGGRTTFESTLTTFKYFGVTIPIAVEVRPVRYFTFRIGVEAVYTFSGSEESVERTVYPGPTLSYTVSEPWYIQRSYEMYSGATIGDDSVGEINVRFGERITYIPDWWISAAYYF